MQNGATSMVGQCVIQLAKSRGIHSINIIRDRCSFEGSSHVSRASKYCFNILLLPSSPSSRRLYS